MLYNIILPFLISSYITDEEDPKGNVQSLSEGHLDKKIALPEGSIKQGKMFTWI